MTRAVEDREIRRSGDSKRRAYTPSWVNHLTAWVDRLPGASWLYYVGLGLIVFSVQTIVLWVEKAHPIGTFLPFHGFLAGAMAFLLSLFTYLDERAGAALATLQPALKATEQEQHEIRYQLTTLPSGSTLLASVVTLGVILLTEVTYGAYRPEALSTYPVSANLLRTVYFICWWIFGAFLYHTVRQLMLINHIYTRHTQINLFQMKPLYAFSNLSALTAGSLTMLTYGWIVVNPDVSIDDPVVLLLSPIILIVAIATFIWPQLGIHRLQVAEKERILEEANRRFEATLLELHRRVDDGELERMEELNSTLASLEIELRAIKRIHTWPWQPETVRWLATALVLPLGLWIIQFLLQRMLGP